MKKLTTKEVVDEICHDRKTMLCVCGASRSKMKGFLYLQIQVFLRVRSTDDGRLNQADGAFSDGSGVRTKCRWSPSSKACPDKAVISLAVPNAGD